MRTKLLDQGVLEILFISILVAIVVWGKQPLSSIGLQVLHWQSQLTPLEFWFPILAVVTGGIIEEMLYRGYTIEPLSSLPEAIGSGAIAQL